MDTVSASSRGLVLGEKTALPAVPLAAGPGRLLSNSPFYFLDLVFDEIKIALTPKPKARVKLQMTLAAEKLAELRLLFSQENHQGFERALYYFAKHIKGARVSLEQVKGQEVGDLARALNQMVDQSQDFLKDLEGIALIEEKFILKSAQVKIAKEEMAIEAKLPSDEFEEETLKELSQGLEEEIKESSQAAERMIQLRQELEQKIAKNQESVMGKQTQTSKDKATNNLPK